MQTPIELSDLSVLFATAWKGLLVITLAGVVSAFVSRRSAAVKHLVWCSALLTLVMIPIAAVVLPAWQMQVPAKLFTPNPTVADNDTANSDIADSDAVSEKRTIRTETEDGILTAPSATSSVRVDTRDPQVESESGRSVDTKIVLPPLATLIWFVWFGGFVVVLANMLVGHAIAWRTSRRAAVADDVTRRLMEDAKTLLAIDRAVDLRSSRAVRVPSTWGMLRPTILLPEEYVDWSSERLRMVLTHELGHAKRLDWLTQTVSHVACAIHWFNPLVWVARAKMIREQEAATDDLVLQAGNAAHDYATNLLDIARAMRRRDIMFSLSQATIAMSRPSTLEGRLVAILDEKRSRTALYGRRVAGTTVLVSMLVIPFAMLQPTAAVATQPVDVLHVSTDTTRVQALLAALAAERNEDVRVLLIRIVGELKSPLATEPLVALLANDSSEVVRRTAAYALAEIEDPLAVDALSRALSTDASASVRRHAVWALRELDTEASIPALREALLNDESEEIRMEVATTLGKHGEAPDITALESALSDSSPRVRQHAAWALGEIASPQSAGALERALTDASDAVVGAAVQSLGQLGDERAVEAIASTASHDDPEVRSAAMHALGQIGGDAALGALGHFLSDEEEHVREQATWALGEIGSAASADVLIRAVDDESSRVRRSVARALGHIGSDNAADALIRMLRDDPDSQVRMAAAWALGEIDS